MSGVTQTRSAAGQGPRPLRDRWHLATLLQPLPFLTGRSGEEGPNSGARQRSEMTVVWGEGEPVARGPGQPTAGSRRARAPERSRPSAAPAFATGPGRGAARDGGQCVHAGRGVTGSPGFTLRSQRPDVSENSEI